MSLTGSDDLLAAVHEDGINDVIVAFFTSRPRYLRIGSPFFQGATTVSGTRVDPIDIGGGIQFLIELDIPKLDLHPSSFGFELPPDQNQFAFEIKGRVTVLCRKKDPERKDDQPRGEPITTELGICARGHIERDGSDLIFCIDQVEIKDIRPDSLESILECIFRMVLNDIFATIRIPYDNLFIQINETFPTGTLTPSGDPFIANDQVQAKANFTI